MDATIAVALIAGIFSLVSTSLQVTDKIKDRRQTALTSASTTQVAAEESAAKRLDERYERYVEKLEASTAKAEARAEQASVRADKAEQETAQVRAKLFIALERIDQLEGSVARGQLRIRELESKGTA